MEEPSRKNLFRFFFFKYLFSTITIRFFFKWQFGDITKKKKKKELAVSEKINRFGIFTFQVQRGNHQDYSEISCQTLVEN